MSTPELLPTLLTVAAVHLAAVATPGANFLVVSSHALSHTRRVGLFTAFGVATGSLVFITTGFLGFAVVISRSALMFNLIKVVGAVYFLYFGARMLWALRQPTSSAVVESALLSQRRAYRVGFTTALANPASAIYFLSLFTTFISTAAPLSEKLLLAVMLLSISAGWYILLALFFSHPRVQAVYRRLRPIINLCFGLTWIALAFRLLAARPPG